MNNDPKLCPTHVARHKLELTAKRVEHLIPRLCQYCVSASNCCASVSFFKIPSSTVMGYGWVLSYHKIRPLVMSLIQGVELTTDFEKWPRRHGRLGRMSFGVAFDTIYIYIYSSLRTRPGGIFNLAVPLEAEISIFFLRLSRLLYYYSTSKQSW